MSTVRPTHDPSFAQERFWFLDGMVAGNSAHTTQQLYSLTGDLRVDALSRAVTAVADRHEVVRTRYVVDGDAPRIGYTPDGSVALRVTDLTAWDDPHAAARAAAVDEAFTPFDLRVDALVRVHLFVLGPGEHLLVITAHRAVFDDHSFRVLERELGAEYAVAVRAAPASAKPLPRPYADHARAQREYDGEDLAHWRNALADAPPGIALPFDKARPAVPSYRADEVEFTVPAPTCQALSGLGGSVRAAALAAFAATMTRYSRAEEVVIGVEVDGRRHSDARELIGPYVTHLPLRVAVSADTTPVDLLADVQDLLRTAESHDRIPFDRIIAEVGGDRDLSRHPAFQVIFGFDEHPGEPSLTGVAVRRMPPGALWSRVDLELHLTHSPSGGLTGRLCYAKDLFERGTPERVIHHYLSLLAAMGGAGQAPLSTVDVLTDAERHLVLDGWNTVDESLLLELTFAELFERQVRSTPDNTAVVFGAESLSYSELNARANRLAGYLIDAGVNREVLVGMCLRRSFDLMTAVLAILKAGGAYLPLDPDNPVARNEFLLRDTGTTLVLTDRALLPSLPALADTRYIDLAEVMAEVASTSAADPPARADADSMIYVIHTSGSTGKPKGVVMTHRPLVNLITWQLHRTPVTGPTAQFSSIGFDISFEEMFATWLTGATLVLIGEEDRRDPERLLAVLRAGGVRRLYCPPMVLEAIAGVETDDLPPLAEIITAGEALRLTPEVRRLLVRLGDVAIDNQYGPTEAHVITGHRLTGPSAAWPALPPVGSPVTNARVYVLDEHSRPVPIGAVGEVHVGGVCLARGYLGRPELTEERFPADPFISEAGARMYRTGDLARWRSDGTLQFLGRVDEQVKIRGYRVEPGEVAAVLNEHSDVVESAVLPITVGDDRRLAAYVVVDPSTSTTAAQLRKFLRDTLPDHMVPAHVVPVDRIPLTPVGKIDRKGLPDPTAPAPERAPTRAPATALEAALAVIWQETIGVDRVGPDENFFHIGGHSLIATKVVARVRTDLGVELSVRTLFEHSTVARMAAAIESRSADTAQAPRTAVLGARPDPSVAPLSPVQHGMWLLHRIHPDCPAYHMPLAFELVGDLDLEALDRALTMVVSRHEALRIVITEDGTDAAQRISPPAGVAFAAVDLRHVPTTEIDAVLANRMAEVVRAPFVLTGPRLWRAVRFHVDERRQVLLLVVHHLVSDGWSMEIVKRDLSCAYSAVLDGRRPEWSEHTGPGFADIAAWEAGPDGRRRAAREVEFWRSRLDPDTTPLDLPGRTRDAAVDFTGERVRDRLGRETASAVRTVAARAGVSTFSVLLSAFATLMGRYSRRDDIQIGTPLTVRDHDGADEVVGLFTNTVVLRCSLDTPTFLDLVRQTHERVVEAIDHPHVPFEALVSELAPGRDGQRTPLFDLWFNLLSFSRADLVLPGIDVREMDTPLAGALFDLGAYLHEHDDGLDVEIVYRPGVFPRARVESLLRHYLEVIELAVRSPELPPAQVRPISLQVPRTQFAPVPTTSLVERVEATVRASPGRHAVDSVSYADLWRRVERRARSMSALGARPGRLVLLAGRRNPELLVNMLAARRAGAAFCVLDLDSPAGRLRDQLDRVRPAVVDGTLPAEVLAHTDAAILTSLEGPVLAAVEPEYPTDLAYVAFTSGSTGHPQGVLGAEAPVTAFFDWYAAELALTARDRFAVLAGMGHDPLLRELLLPLWVGAVACLPEDAALSTPEATVRWLARQECSVVHLTPARARLLAGVARRAGLVVPSVRVVALGGGPVAPTDRAALLAVFPRARALSLYGTTETPQGISLVDLGDELLDQPHPPLGVGSPSAELLVLDPDGGVCGVNEVGEVAVRSPHLALGYAADPEATRARFRPDVHGAAGIGVHLTGDRGRYRPDGVVEHLGRLDRQLSIEGTRVEPAEVERVALAHSGVDDCVLFARDGDLVLVATPADHDDSLLAYLRARLPAPMVPGVVVRVASIPLTANGKPNPAAVASIPVEQPKGDVVDRVADTWRRVLGLTGDVDVDATFFAAGGTSLGLLRLHHALREALDDELAIAELFQYQTIRKLAARLSRGTQAPMVPSAGRRRSSALDAVKATRISARYAARFAVDRS